MFTKHPWVGPVKTRMTHPNFSPHPMTPTEARELHVAFLRDLIPRYQRQNHFDFRVLLKHTSEEQVVQFCQHFELDRAWVDVLPDWQDLGHLMEDAFERYHAKGYQRMVLTGSDAPQLPQAIIEQALVDLVDHEMVLGPDNGGGWYLFACAKPTGILKQPITWGQGVDQRQMLDYLKQSSIKYKLLPEQLDLDTTQDLLQLYEALKVTEVPGNPTNPRLHMPHTWVKVRQYFDAHTA